MGHSVLRTVLQALSESQSGKLRRSLYEVLLECDVLVPFDGDTSTTRHFAYGYLSDGRTVLPVFSDFDALENWGPSTGTYQIVRGIDVFRRVAERHGAAILINPSEYAHALLNQHEVTFLAHGRVPELASIFGVADVLSLPLVSYAERVINLCSMVVGADAQNFLEAFHSALTASGQHGLELTTLSAPGMATYKFWTVVLPDIRGFRTKLHIFAFSPDERLVPVAEEIAPRANSILIASSLYHRLDIVTRAVVETLSQRPSNLPIAVLGSARLAGAFEKLYGRPADHRDYFEVQPFEVYRQLTQMMLAKIHES